MEGIACPAGCSGLKELAVMRQFYVVTHAGRSRSPLRRAFLEFLDGQSPGAV